MTDLNIVMLSEEDALENIGKIARLRIDIFLEYPYLYEGDLEYESKYLKKFSKAPNFMITAIKDGDRIVGAMTGLPLSHEEANVKFPWTTHNLDTDRIYYFSEILLYPKYRRMGHGKRIFHVAEKKIASYGKYSKFALATVVRGKNHPQRPKNYIDTDGFWQKLGYKKQKNLVCHIPWKEIGEKEESNKPLVFWAKNCAAN